MMQVGLKIGLLAEDPPHVGFGARCVPAGRVAAISAELMNLAALLHRMPGQTTRAPCQAMAVCGRAA